ncbi:histidine kinase [Pontimicrobium sp. SW4]|uniref:Histidine kinase n=1 Tax=Pontimicrobium sp. SW4 TaxID=3153519 RepID=A0AAU7BPM0_9FLAO
MLNLNPYLKKLNNHRPFLFNLVLWFCAFVIVLFIFSKGQKPIKVDYIYTICFITSVAIPVVVNLYLFIPKLLKKEKYIGYLIVFALNLIVFTQLHLHLFQPIIDQLFPNYFFISYHSNTNLVVIFSIFLVGTTLIKLSEDWFYFNENENKLLKLQNKQIQLQLISLRSQINPHFLFNSLNVIYALTIEKKDGVKDAIVQLSDILRYVIYDSDTEKVTLKDEITLLKNYIAFQKHRVHGFTNINTDIEVENEVFTIYPMLLLPLFENSFKHGIKGDLSDTFINININQKGNDFTFRIENNLFKESIENQEPSGVGLENIKKNLEIVYPESHSLEITKTKNTFAVTLAILNHDY